MNFNCKCHLAFKLKSYHGQNNPFVIQQVIKFSLCNLYTLFNVCVDVIISMGCDFDFHSLYVPLFCQITIFVPVVQKILFRDIVIGCVQAMIRKQRLKRIFYEMYRMCLMVPQIYPFFLPLHAFIIIFLDFSLYFVLEYSTLFMLENVK